MRQYEKADRPTIYFIGVTTGKSSIMKVFPKWAEYLGLENAVIKGIDFQPHSSAEAYREAVEFIKNDPLSRGALVTTHKIDLYRTCQDLFDYVDPYARQLGEVSSISKKDGMLCAHAKDPISSGLALQRFVPDGFWRDHGGEVLLMGAGGSTLAMSVYFSQICKPGDRPSGITITNRSIPRLKTAEEILGKIDTDVKFSFRYNPDPGDNDRTLAEMPPYSLIVNATGLGKDAPGSPLTDEAVFPEGSLVWEINYRGDLLFARQAEKQEKAKNLHLELGWNYFIYGWTQVIAEVFHIDIDEKMVDELGKIAQ